MLFRRGMVHRSEIDGLRAIAVLSVLLFHCDFPAFSGGYTGVDVFFVISGFLITQKISQQLRERRFSFAAFYVNRARRLFPALFVTVAITFMLGILLMSPTDLARLGESAVSTALSVSNVYFWLKTGYWDADKYLKPLLHTWSLSVEEQFYLVSPAALVALFAIPSRQAAPVAIGLAGAISLAAACYFSAETVFYLAPFRIFEFACGAIIVWIPRKPVADPAFSELGLLLVVLPVFAFSGDTPTAMMIFPCIGAAFLIYAGPRHAISKIWDNAPAHFIGKISYSLYLVHWPLITLYLYWRFEPTGNLGRCGLVVASVLLAVPLHYLIEQPFRRKSEDRLRFSVAWLGLTASIALAGSLAWTSQGWPSRLSFDPDIKNREWAMCVDDAGYCENSHPTLVTIGDSHAGHWSVALAATLRQLHLTGRVYKTANNCALLGGAYPVQIIGEINPCPDLQAEWLASLEKDDPRVVILASFWEEGISEGISGRLVTVDNHAIPSKSKSRELFENKLSATLDLLTSQGRSVVIMGDGPVVERAPGGCYERPQIFGRFGCSGQIRISDPEVHSYLGNLFRQIASQRKNVFFFDTYSFLCKDGSCTLGDGGGSYYYDRHHLSSYGATWIQVHAFSGLTEFLRKAVETSISASPSIPATR